MATLTVNFNSTSTPAGGYTVTYRKVGDPTFSQVSPNPVSSPVLITVDPNYAYEGYVDAGCEEPTYFTAPALNRLSGRFYSKVVNKIASRPVTGAPTGGGIPVSAISNLDNLTVIENGIDVVSLRDLNTDGSSVILTPSLAGNYQFTITTSGDISFTANAGFTIFVDFYLEVDGVQTALSSVILPTGLGFDYPHQFIIISPAGPGTRTGTTAYSVAYTGVFILTTSSIVKLYMEIKAGTTPGSSSGSFTIDTDNTELEIIKQ